MLKDATCQPLNNIQVRLPTRIAVPKLVLFAGSARRKAKDEITIGYRTFLNSIVLPVSHHALAFNCQRLQVCDILILLWHVLPDFFICHPITHPGVYLIERTPLYLTNIYK